MTAESRGCRGFTLVEVVMVLVIVGVLAAVGIPVYFSYVAGAQQSVVDNLAQTGAASANAYFRKTGAHPDSAALDLFLSDPDRFSVSVNSGARTVTIVDNDHSKTGTASY